MVVIVLPMKLHSNPFQLPPSLTHPPPTSHFRETVAATLGMFSTGPGGFILLTAPSLLCIENTVLPFRWRDDGRESENRAAGGVRLGMLGGGARTVPASDFKLRDLRETVKWETDSETGGGEEEGEGWVEEGRKKKKNNNSTKGCVIKTGNGRREEGSGGFQKEAVRGRFSTAEEWGWYPSRLNGNQIIC